MQVYEGSIYLRMNERVKLYIYIHIHIHAHTGYGCVGRVRIFVNVITRNTCLKAELYYW